MENCLFGAAGLTKNDDIVKYKYFGYGKYSDIIINIPDSGYKYSKYAIYIHWIFSHPSGGTAGNCIVFGVDMSSSTKINNKKKIFPFLVVKALCKD